MISLIMPPKSQVPPGGRPLAAAAGGLAALCSWLGAGGLDCWLGVHLCHAPCSSPRPASQLRMAAIQHILAAALRQPTSLRPNLFTASPAPPPSRPRMQVAQTSAMLANEYGTASNIKSRVNRQSVLAAITSAQQRLKLYTRVPPNGLVVYTGTVMTDDGKEKKMNIDFEPFKPINTSLYLCDNKFHTEALNELLEADNK